MMEKPFRDTREYLQAFIRTAQYIPNLTSGQDILAETGRVLASFFEADLVAFFEPGKDGGLNGHHWILPKGVSATAVLTKDTEPLISEVLETGFLAAQHIEIPQPFASVFIPIVRKNQTARVMLVGHRTSDPIPKELLDIYLAVAGLVRGVLERKSAEDLLRRFNEELEQQVRTRTDELNESRGKYRDLVENLNDVIFSIGPEGIFTYISPVIERLYGYTPEEVTGQHFMNFIHPDDRAHVFEGFRRQLAGTYMPDEFRILAKDGTTRHVRVSPRPIENDGSIAGFNYVMTDITARKKAEEKLEYERKQLLSLFNSIDDVVYVCDPYTYRILYVNDALVRAFGKNPTGGICYKEFQGFDKPCDFCTNEILLSNKDQPYKWEYHNPVVDRDFEMVDRLITWPDGREVRFEFAKDITEHKKAEAEIKKAQQEVEEHDLFLQRLIDTIPNPIFYKDKNGVYSGCNTAFEGYIGLPKDQLIGKSVYDIAPKELADIYFAADRELIDNPGTQVYESQVKYADGSLHDVIFNKATFTDIMGDVEGIVGVILDITERKKAEDEERLTRERFETLVKVAGLREASETELSEYVMEAACRMTASKLAFIGSMNEDESVMDIAAWSVSTMQDCRVATSPIHFPIEKAGIWADAVRSRIPKIVNDYSAPLKGKKGLPEGHVAITRFLSLPILEKGRVVMVAAVANKPSDYDDTDVTRLTLLMQGVWGNLKNRRADEALKESETLLNETGEMAKVGGWEIDVGTKEVRMTRETYRIHEIPVGEKYTLERAAGFFDMPGWSTLEAALQRCIETGKPFDLELPFTTATGRHLWTRAVGRAVRDNGKIFKVAGTFQDITELRRAREELRESRQILEGVLNTITVRVFWKDKNLVYIGCNAPFARDAGFEKPGDIIGKDDYAMGWREQAELYRADDLDVIKTGKVKLLFEEPQTTPTGEKIHLLTSKVPLRDANGDIIGVLGTYLDITAYKQAEEALRESEEKFHEIFDNANDAIEIVEILDSGLPGRFLDLNNVACRILGYTKDELLSKSPLEIDTGRFNRPFDQILHELHTTGHATFETEHIRKDGTFIPMEINTHKITLLGKTVFLSIARDITERKRAENALRESEIRFRELFNSMSSGVAVYRALDDGADFEFIDFNHGAEVIEKIEKQDVVGRRVTEVFPGVGAFGILDVFRRVWQTGVSEFHPISMYQDERIASWRENFVYRLPSGEVVAIYEDVTARKQAEEALLESEEKFRDIFNNTTDAIHIHEIGEDGTPGKFTDVNDVACRMLGYTREELLAMTPLEISTDYHDPPLDRIFEKQRTRGVARFETEHRTKDGTIIPVEVNTHVVTIQGKKVMLGVVRDMTEHRKAEALLRDFNVELEQQVKAQTEEINASLKEKVLLLREIHHRVKNNLQIIISLVNLQMRQIDDDRLKQVMRETQNRVRAMSLVHEKLYQSEDISVINLADYTRFLAAQLFTYYGVDSRQVKLEMQIDRILLDINTAVPLGLIINELVSNALRHAFPDQRPGLIRITAHQEGNSIYLTIQDNGIGMPREFDWKTSRTLGFRLVVNLIDQLNGTIEQQPSAEGLVFVIRIEKVEVSHAGD